MTFGLTPGKLGFKLGDVLIGLQSGTTDVPEAIKSTEGRLHGVTYLWNPDTLAYEVATTTSITSSPGLSLELDSVGGGVLYVGEAEAGAASSAAAWRIKRVTLTGADVSVKWADGDALFNNVWDDRASLSY